MTTPRPSTTTPFQRFVFASNDVCVSPSVFYDTIHNENDNNDGISSKRRWFRLRNVPGEGDCMFQAVALATSTSMGLGGNASLLKAIASETRNVVAQILSNPHGNLLVEQKRLVRTKDLLSSAAKQEHTSLSPQEYLERLKDGRLQGGGPELTVLSNVLRRPISIYELLPNNNNDADDDDTTIPQKYPIQKVATFGDHFVDPCQSIPDSAILSPGLQPGAYSWHIHILIVDSGNQQKHACVLLPHYPSFSSSSP